MEKELKEYKEKLIKAVVAEVDKNCEIVLDNVREFNKKSKK